MPDIYRLLLVESLKEIIDGLGDDHAVCLWCEDEAWYQVDDLPHHVDCRVGEALTLIERVGKLHQWIGDEVCGDPPAHNCRENDLTCGCRCEGCVDETEERCDECNDLVGDGTEGCQGHDFLI